MRVRLSPRASFYRNGTAPAEDSRANVVALVAVASGVLVIRRMPEALRLR